MRKSFISVFITLLLFISGCYEDGNILKEHRETLLAFDSFVSIQCLYKKHINITFVIQECRDRLRKIESDMNSRSASGYIARINETGFEGVSINKDVHNVLKESIKISEITKGAFDVTVFPLIELWKDQADKNILPLENEVKYFKDLVDYKNIELSVKDMAYLKKKGSKIDLGAIAKGYAVDEIAKILRKNRIKDFLIDAGGDIYCGGSDKDRSLWKIGVQNPEKDESIIDIVYLEDRAVTTSGDYERYVSIEGRNFSHIIDPRTGYPQEGVISATVIAPKAIQADALSTALCVLGSEKGIDIINSIENVEAMIVEKIGGEIISSFSERYNSYKVASTTYSQKK